MKVAFETVFFLPKKQEIVAKAQGITQMAYPSVPLSFSGLKIHTETKTIYLLTGDLLFVPLSLEDYCTKFLQSLHPNTSFELLFFASHAHSLPNLDPKKPVYPLASQETIEQHQIALTDLLNKLVHRKYSDCALEFASWKLPSLTINRRRKALKWNNGKPIWEIDFLPNKNATVNELFQLLRFKDQSNQKILGNIGHWACHPVCYPENQIHPDFPFFLREQFSQTQNIPFLFINGFTGACRPNLGIEFQLKRFWKGKVFGEVRSPDYQNWIKKLCAFPKEINFHKLNGEDALIQTVYLSKEKWWEGHSPYEYIKISAMRLGDEVVVLGVSGEMMREFEEQLKSIFPNKILITGSYLSECVAYLPTDQMIKEKGYESVDFIPYFGLNGRFKVSLENLFQNVWLSLATSLWPKK